MASGIFWRTTNWPSVSIGSVVCLPSIYIFLSIEVSINSPFNGAHTAGIKSLLFVFVLE